MHQETINVENQEIHQYYPVIRSECEFLNLYYSGCIYPIMMCMVLMDCELTDVFYIESIKMYLRAYSKCLPP